MMDSFLLTRILILIVLFGLTTVGGSFLKTRALKTKVDPLTLSKLSSNQPSILMFSSKTCPPCEKVQKPIIRRLMENQMSSIHFHEIDVELEPQIAQNWGVFTVPTLFLLDENGKAHFVHHGIATEKILSAQIKELI